MVVLGGITRLTGSGLSMVDWRPIMGAVPPLNHREWLEVFARYQHSPQYLLVNRGMSLEAFQGIFFWEYVHRLLGRFIGVVFLVPWLSLVVRRRLPRRLAVRLAGGFVLGGLQGGLGWFMVRSGLVNELRVSHYRLAAHLVLALLVLAYLLWILLDLREPAGMLSAPAQAHPWLKRVVAGLAVLVLIQIVLGAFTAGLKAGFGFNTFPLMNGAWIPTGLLPLTPAWRNLLDSPMTVQFAHRTVAWILLGAAAGVALASRRAGLSPAQRVSLRLFAALVSLQFALGVTTLLLIVPTAFAVAHQLCACVVFVAIVAVNHAFRVARP